MIEVKNIEKSFADKKVLNGIDLVFEKGKTNLVIGQSGSGKTVFLKCMVGLFVPEKGQIFYDGRDFIKMTENEKKEIRKEIGMVFQGGALFDSMTVEENVRFPLDMFSTLSEKEKTKRVNFCLERVNLNNANNLLPAEISGGMKKRVSIARAIALDIKYLFCDEPNSGLDPETSIVIDKLIYEITHEFGITTIINTHDMNSVYGIGDKVVYLYKGEKNWEGSGREIFDTDNERLKDFIFASDLMKRLAQ
jgi:phospholipid/cholesterol/gamma-HCH transport system ATP-binding protein